MSMLTRLEQALFSTGCHSATALLWCTAVSGDRAVQRHAVLCNRVTAGCGTAKAGAQDACPASRVSTLRPSCRRLHGSRRALGEAGPDGELRPGELLSTELSLPAGPECPTVPHTRGSARLRGWCLKKAPPSLQLNSHGLRLARKMTSKGLASLGIWQPGLWAGFLPSAWGIPCTSLHARAYLLLPSYRGSPTQPAKYRHIRAKRDRSRLPSVPTLLASPFMRACLEALGWGLASDGGEPAISHGRAHNCYEERFLPGFRPVKSP
ncbi:hypothetical protein L1887_60180 [Cichorium endivia]|nr:hypothetical protein L1887_60180 [Cichorium endivia]